MNFLNRAIKNVTRVKSRSILLMITFFILGNLVIVGLGVSQAVADAKTETRKNMRAVVTYDIDYDAVYEYMNTLETYEEQNEFYRNIRITKEQVTNLVGSDERVVAVNYLQSVQLYDPDFETIVLDNENTNSSGGGSVIFDDGTTATWMEPSLILKGNLFTNMIEFEEKSYTIVEGRMYSQEEIDAGAHVVLVEQGLAELNGFKIGDRITVNIMQEAEFSYYGGSISKSDTELELEIIGIYDNTQVLNPSDPDYEWMPSYFAPENTLLVPTTTYIKSQIVIERKIMDYYRQEYPGETWYDREITEEDLYFGSVVMLLRDPLEVEDFIADNQDALSEFYQFNANLDSFNKIARPLDAMARFAGILVGIIVVNALVIITLITALTLKNREYEIGVLLAMGVSKVKVIGQMFIELVIVGILGFTLAVASGAVISGVIGDWMLEAQLSTELIEEDSNNWSGWYGDENYFTDVTADEMFEQYKVSVKPVMIVWIYAGGLAVIFASVLIPGLMVMRYNPKQILTNVR